MELRVEVRPRGPFRLPLRSGMDGVLRHRGGVLERLLHHGGERDGGKPDGGAAAGAGAGGEGVDAGIADDGATGGDGADVGEPVVVRVAQPAPDRVLFGARARERAGAEYGIARMRFALGVDDDLEEFHRRFRRDPLIGRSLRARPWLRVPRRPEPFEALAWAICEQLIEYERAAAIQRRIVGRLGLWHPGWDGWDGRERQGRGARAPGLHGSRGSPGGGAVAENRRGRRDRGARGRTGLCDAPSPVVLAGAAPALLQSLDLAGARALTLIRAAREIARGRIDLYDATHERAWHKLRAIAGIGPWTVERLALHGQGRHDQLPAGDVGLLKLVGRLRSGGDPHARATEPEVRDFFAPYGAWAGLAATHMLGAADTSWTGA